MARIRIKRGTRAQLNHAAASGDMTAGEPYLVTDEGVMACGLSATTYADADRGAAPVPFPESPTSPGRPGTWAWDGVELAFAVGTNEWVFLTPVRSR